MKSNLFQASQALSLSLSLSLQSPLVFIPVAHSFASPAEPETGYDGSENGEVCIRLYVVSSLRFPNFWCTNWKLKFLLAILSKFWLD